jgi:hypothetical protein
LRDDVLKSRHARQKFNRDWRQGPLDWWMPLFAMSILRARRPSIRSTRSLGRFPFSSRAIETGPRALSIGSPLIARSPVARSPIEAIFSLMLGVAFSRRGLIHPRRQYFQVDQFVEFNRRVSHECLLPQADKKTSVLSNLVAQFWAILLLAVRQRVG